MVSLDDAVVARWEYGGKRYEVLLDPDLVETFRESPDDVNLDDLMAAEDVFHDARQGERPAVDDVVIKEGKTGTLCFVTVSQRTAVDGTRCIVEQQDLVYRDDPDVDAPKRQPEPAPTDADINETVTPSEVLLFR